MTSQTFWSLFAFSMLLISLASVLLFAIENSVEAHRIQNAVVGGVYDPSMYQQLSGPWDAIWLILLVIFSVELLVRLVCYPSPWCAGEAVRL